MFDLVASYKPTGDQPIAIDKLVNGIKHGTRDQVLLGVTGSGKTFTIANVIAQTNKPTLIISHNKTLAAQLYQEFKGFFPNNSVQYFVSYYDYYQPEAYIPQRDLYIEKDSSINEEIDKLRLATTSALLSRKDVIVISSVSCIYNIGSPREYHNAMHVFEVGEVISHLDIQSILIDLRYERNELDFVRGTFRVRGNSIDVYPSYEDIGVKITIQGKSIVEIKFFDPVSGQIKEDYYSLTSIVNREGKRVLSVAIYPAKHYVFNSEKVTDITNTILLDMSKQVEKLKGESKLIEAHRLKQKVEYDVEMIKEIGYCKGIENYSIYFDERSFGDPPFSLLDYFGDDYLMIVDESHITIPQVGGMYNGDRARKETLVNYGFRLPSALDNRPLRFSEFRRRQKTTIYMSATPGDYELSLIDKKDIAEQLIRPTGLVDPVVYVKPAKNQILDLIDEIVKVVEKGERALVTTLTKKMAEELTDYLNDRIYEENIVDVSRLGRKIEVAYLHADIDTLERTDILDDLRRGKYDVLVGINLLREGLDLPEVSLVAILDADKEGFLRSKTSLIQTMGRAARHIEGRVIMYADQITKSMREALDEVERRRNIQIEYNEKNNITPVGIKKGIRERIIPKVEDREQMNTFAVPEFVTKDIDIMLSTFRVSDKKSQRETLRLLKAEMKNAANLLDFERAIELRDILKKLNKK